MAAIAGARSGARALLIEKKENAGRKLLLSGAGRCNLSHSGEIADFLANYGHAGRFLKSALYAFTNADARRFFEERGIRILEEETGKLFPVSGKARDLVDTLLAETLTASAEIQCRRALSRLEAPQAPNAAFRAFCAPAASEAAADLVHAAVLIEAKRVVLALGGRSYPASGSSGEGYAIAEALGHRIVPTAPALSPLLVSGFPAASLAGTALADRALAVYRSGSKIARGRGDILFTHRGLSGPGILDLSRSVLPGDEIGIELCGRNTDWIDALVLEGARVHGKRLVRSLLEPFGLPSRLLQTIVGVSTGDSEARAASLTKEARKRLAASLAELRMTVDALGDWDEAMATRGGVALDEVDPKTMESRIVKGLYFAGEMLDIDGNTGGYNIQAAFSTGFLAGSSASRSL